MINHQKIHKIWRISQKSVKTATNLHGNHYIGSGKLPEIIVSTLTMPSTNAGLSSVTRDGNRVSVHFPGIVGLLAH